MDLDALIDAGLYDPNAPDASDRLALLRYVDEAGATLDDIVEAEAERSLTSLVSDIHLRRGGLTANDLAARAGAPIETMREIYRLLGIPIDDVDDPVFDEREARFFDLLATGANTLPDGVGDEILRAISSALTIVAESAVSAFVGSFEDELEQQGTPLHRAEVTTAMGDLGLEVGAMMGPLFRHHLRAAVARQRAAMRSGEGRLESKLAVGFVDLVGFTATTASMTSPELLSFIRSFHSRTYDVVTDCGGRVVKHIGDEIMFTASDAAHGCEIALALVDAFADVESLPRGGLAFGTLMARHGDFYGPIVNLAARLADIAVPGEVLADAGIATWLDDGRFALDPAGQRSLKGFAEPVAVVAVRRAAA